MLFLLLNLLVALIGTECLHNAIEVWGMRQKVRWLEARMSRQKHGKWPVNINTTLKAYGLHTGIFIVFTAVIFGVLLAFRLTPTSLIFGGICALVLNYALTTAAVHAFHLEIGKLLRQFKQR